MAGTCWLSRKARTTLRFCLNISTAMLRRAFCGSSRQAALILALIPIFAAVIAVVGLGEPVGVAQALGGTLVVGAAAVAARADEAPLV